MTAYTKGDNDAIRGGWYDLNGLPPEWASYTPQVSTGRGFIGSNDPLVSAYATKSDTLGPYPLTFLGGFRLKLPYLKTDNLGNEVKLSNSSGGMFVDVAGGEIIVGMNPNNNDPSIGFHNLETPVIAADPADTPIAQPSRGVNDSYFVVAPGNFGNATYISGIYKFGDDYVCNLVNSYGGNALPGFPNQNVLTLPGATTVSYKVNQFAEAAGWMVPIPAAWQAALGGDMLMGNAPNWSINGDLPQGPTLYAWNAADRGSTLECVTHMVRNLSNPLGTYGKAFSDYLNVAAPTNPAYVEDSNSIPRYTQESLQNAPVGYPGRGNVVFNERTTVRYGFIRDNYYIVFGQQTSVDHGYYYKQFDSEGYNNGGYGSWVDGDNSPWYWVFDLNEVIAAGDPGTIEPIEHGPLNISHGIRSACLVGDDLYILHYGGGVDARIQSSAENEPYVEVYRLGAAA